MLLIDSDMTELTGIQWFLQTYLPREIDVKRCTSIAEAGDMIRQFEPEVILLNLDFLPKNNSASFYQLLQQRPTTIFAMTAEPLFKNAMQAIEMQVAHLFVKPIDLELLKKKLMALSFQQTQTNNTTTTEDTFYYKLFSDSNSSTLEKGIHFTIIEPEHPETLNALYAWLLQTTHSPQMKLYPLSKSVVCLFYANDQKAIEKHARTLIREWSLLDNCALNIGIYDGAPTTLNTMYTLTKRALRRSFHEGFEHIFYATKPLEIRPFDPFLTPDEQQLFIKSLEDGNLEAVKTFLYRLSNEGSYYEQDDLRIHLTSVLAQIRRFMLKYNLQQHAATEQQYRQLFHVIIEHPIFYTIVREMIDFTQSLMALAYVARVEKKANYAELAVEMIEGQFQDSTLSLPAIAQQLGISPNYLSAIFSKKQGLPLKRFLQQVRIQNATKMLVDTDYAVSEVARLNGFDDPNYFVKLFKQQMGTTPFRYRKARVKI